MDTTVPSVNPVKFHTLVVIAAAKVAIVLHLRGVKRDPAPQRFANQIAQLKWEPALTQGLTSTK